VTDGDPRPSLHPQLHRRADLRGATGGEPTGEDRDA